ncbi:MAG TPA: nitroreductase family deazaflavin-dependent oxidoreductase [Anaerolineales bacterium]|nr:nitroreductase family deazaflavin-dependent oxidoreductase [Anaerolineales bacterium]
MAITQKKPTGFLRILFRAPIFLYRINFGWLLGSRFLLLSHTGRKSGLPRHVVIEVVSHDKKNGEYYIAAAWRKKSDWYLNILKNPRVKVQVGNRQFEAEANQKSEKEAEDIFWDYAQKHPVALRELTLMMLGERLPPTRETCARLAQSIPLIGLNPIMVFSSNSKYE